MTPKICLNTITIKQATLEEKIRVTADAGYKGIGLWVNEIREYVERVNDMTHLKKMLKEHNLQAAEICFIGGWHYTTGEAKRKALVEAEDILKIARFLECPCVIAPASVEEGSIARSVEDFAGLCELGAKYGVSVAFEFLGFAKQVRDIKLGWEIVQETASEYGGLVLDTFHFHRGGSKIEDLKAVSVDKIFLVHINDAMDVPKEMLQDKHRVFPGEGVIGLKELLGVLAAKGYDGYYSLEIFNEDYWAAAPSWVAAEGFKAVTRVLET